MSVDTLESSPRRLVRPPDTLLTTSRGMDLSPGMRKPSAVERLEADKAKYVKSQQVALNRQLPIIRKALMPSTNHRPPQAAAPVKPPQPAAPVRPPQSAAPVKPPQPAAPVRPPQSAAPVESSSRAPQPMRKMPVRPSPRAGAPPLDLKHLSNLINGVSDTVVLPNSANLSSSVKPKDSEMPMASKPLSPTANAAEEMLVKSVSSPTAQVKPFTDSLGVSSTSTVTVRRVDVRPQLPQVRKPRVLPLQSSERPINSRLVQLLKPYMQNSEQQMQPLSPQTIGIKSQRHMVNKSPVKSPANDQPNILAQPLQNKPSKDPNELPAQSSVPEVVSPLCSNATLPPSPAITRLSSVSSRKRASLTRSKSDVSDRFSRAGAEVERFFNYCGLDPTDFDELTPGSDIASVSRLRSASAPASERSGENEEEEEEEEGAKEKVTSYGISVIERNARVIKWLYGMRQAKDSTKVANV